MASRGPTPTRQGRADDRSASRERNYGNRGRQGGDGGNGGNGGARGNYPTDRNRSNSRGREGVGRSESASSGRFQGGRGPGRSESSGRREGNARSPSARGNRSGGRNNNGSSSPSGSGGRARSGHNSSEDSGNLSNLAAQMPQLRIANLKRKEAEKVLEQRGLEPMTPYLADKANPSTLGTAVQLTTNVHGVRMSKHIPVFRYDLTIRKVQRGKTMAFPNLDSLKGNNEFVKWQRREQNKIVYGVLIQRHSGYFGGPGTTIYDFQSALYSLKELDTNGRGQRILLLHRQEIENAGMGQILEPFDVLQVTVKKVTEKFQLTLAEVSKAVALETRDPSDVDRSLAQFIETATNEPIIMADQHQWSVRGQGFLLDPERHGFAPADTVQLTNEMYLAIGVHKAIRFIEGPKGRGACNSSFIVETKKSPFYNPMPMIDKARIFVPNIQNWSDNDLRILNRELKHCYAWTEPSHQLVKILEFAPLTANSHSISVVGKGQVTVRQYYKGKHKRELDFPDAPMARVKMGMKGKTYVPLELLQFADGQRPKMNQGITDKMIKACAIEPRRLLMQNELNFRALTLTSETLDNAGISVISAPLAVTGRMLQPPALLYGQNRTVNIPESNKWRTSGTKYHKPAQMEGVAWGVIHIEGSSDRFQRDTATNFVQWFMKMCREKELHLAEPLLTNDHPIHRVRADRDAFVAVLTDLRQRGALYALIMHTDSDKRLHDVMKRHERVCEGIITQGVKTSTVLKVMDKHLGQTMENLVNKANVKLGGLNYTLNTERDKKAHFVLDKNLFIGIGTNHPSGGMGLSSSGNGKGKGRQDAPPSVVGYAANYNPDPFEFCGDFILQETRRDEKVTIIEHIVKTCLDRYNTTHQRYPARVILYRNGCTEGQFPDILRYEVPLVEAAIGSVCEAKLTLIVPNKMHNLRIFLKDIPQGAKIEQQNIPPGTLVDTQVVHPVNNEFYLNSHLSSQGTVKSPRYTVLHDANNLGSDRLQCMTWYLCYGHQIVNLPVSLPAPVYIADLYAYRGRSCYNACVTAPQNHPDHELAHLPLHRLTEALNYEAAELTNFRVNA